MEETSAHMVEVALAVVVHVAPHTLAVHEELKVVLEVSSTAFLIC